VPEKVIDSLKNLTPQYLLPQVAVVSAPILAQHFGPSSFVWPPLGGLETFAAYAATVAIGLCSLLPLLLDTKQQAKVWLKRAVIASFLMFILYSILVARYVIRVETPANGLQVRSVGFRVEPRIRALFPDKNDWELLRIGGLEDWQINKVWTPNSVLALRMSLLTTFALTFGAANVAIGAAKRANTRKA
jgi:hypothetical protein